MNMEPTISAHKEAHRNAIRTGTTARAVGLLCLLLLALLAAGCAPVPPAAAEGQITVRLIADSEETAVQVPLGSTVQQALNAAGLTLEALDRTEPPLYTSLSGGSSVRLIRVTEEFELEQSVVPFERQTLRNEALAKDVEVLVQKGRNGLEETTYRRVFEDGIEVSDRRVPVKTMQVEEPVPEIVMIGIQSPFFPVDVPGRMVYLHAGNVWVIEESTGNRRAAVTTGDLDGRIFALSDDGNWLLFTRQSDAEGEINTLWAADISGAVDDEGETPLIDLNVPNVIHFADWVPGSNIRIVFSTVESRTTAPGWQANNDLQALTFSNTGWTTKWSTILEPNTGGVYGWWGSHFAWSPDRQTLAYVRPDGVGLIDFREGTLTPLKSILPLQTRGDWAWVTGLAWGPDGNALYLVDHIAPEGSAAPEESTEFALMVIPLAGGPSVHLVSQTGMFAYPLASPSQVQPSGENAYQVAYLQALFANQSDTSRYQVAVMDRDGSDRRILFPPEGSTGLEPQREWGVWSPAPLPDSGQYALAVIYQGDLWLVDTSSGESQQITGDGLTTRVIWK